MVLSGVMAQRHTHVTLVQLEPFERDVRIWIIKRLHGHFETLQHITYC